MPARSQQAPTQVFNMVSFNLRHNHAGNGANSWSHRKEMAASVSTEHQVDIAGLQEALKGMIDDLQGLLPDYG